MTTNMIKIAALASAASTRLKRRQPLNRPHQSGLRFATELAAWMVPASRAS